MTKEKILDYLISLKGGQDKKGLYYLIDIIYELLEDSNVSLQSLYNKVGFKEYGNYEKRLNSRVERCVRQYIYNIYENHNKNHNPKVDDLHCILNDKGVPINKEFIFAVLNYLKKLEE